MCGYPPRDLVEVPAFVARSREVLEQIAAEFADIAIIAGFPSPAASETGKTVMNSAALLRHGRIDFVQSKRLLPTYDVFDEMRTFAPAPVQRLFCIGERVRRADHLRGCVERQGLLEPPSVRHPIRSRT